MSVRKPPAVVFYRGHVLDPDEVPHDCPCTGCVAARWAVQLEGVIDEMARDVLLEDLDPAQIASYKAAALAIERDILFLRRRPGSGMLQ